MRNQKPIAAAAILIAAIGFSVAWALKHRHKPAPASVKSVTATPTVFQGTEITLTGRLQARTSEQVDAAIAGILDAWFVDVGGEVYEDQLVGRIRNADLDSALQQAQSALDRAELRIAQFEAQSAAARLEVSRTAADQIRARNELDRLEKIYVRQRNLMDAGAIARLTFEKTETDYNNAKAESANRDASAKDAQEKAKALTHDSEESKRAVAESTAAVAKATEAVAQGDLHSPADGVILTRTVHQADHVEASAKALMTVATDLTKVDVSLTPDPPVLARIHAGQHAFVRIDSDELPGEVHEVRGTQVIVQFTSPAPITKLGIAAQVRIVL
jgi:multidrug resistance efflux pump